MSKPGASSTVLEKIAGSTKTDGWAALVACVIVIGQVVGLVLGVDLLRSIPAEWVIGLFGVTAFARRKLANGRGVRERSVEDLPIPKFVRDQVTAPLPLPAYLREDSDDGEGEEK